MQFKYLISFILGRANYGQIVTDVEVVEGVGEYAGNFLVMKSGESDMEKSIVSDDQEIKADTVIVIDETEFMVGNDLEKMIEIYNKFSVDNYEVDLIGAFEKMKLNLNKQICIDQ